MRIKLINNTIAIILAFNWWSITTSFSLPPLTNNSQEGKILTSSSTHIHSRNQLKILPYHKWVVLTTKPLTPIQWSDEKHTLNLTLSPTKEERIKIDLVINTKDNSISPQPFFSLNIGNSSIILNKISQSHHGYTYSTIIHKPIRDDVVESLKKGLPIQLIISDSFALLIDTNLLTQSSSFSNFWKDVTSTRQPNNNFTSINKSHIPDGMPPSLLPLYNQANDLIHQCLPINSYQLSTQERKTICEKRNNILSQMQIHGWCWGSGDPDQHDKDKNWRKCIMTPKGGVKKLENKKVEDFNKAKRISNN